MSGRRNSALYSISFILALLFAPICSAQQAQINPRTPTEDARRTYYMLQVGIYRKVAGADAIIEQLKKANFGFYQREKYTTAGGKTRYRVRIGPFASRDQADEASSALGELDIEPLLLERQGTPPATASQSQQPQNKIVGIPLVTARAAPVPKTSATVPAAPAQSGQTQQQTAQPQRQVGPAGATPTPAGAAPQGRQPAQSAAQAQQQQAQTNPAAPQKVGQASSAKSQEKAPEVQAIAELGGVLTPRGSLILEPLFEYSNS